VSRWRRAQLALLWFGARHLGRRSTAVGGWLASALWFTPWPTPSTAASTERERAWLADAQPLDLRVHGRRVHGYAAGHGPTVLLVHGWGDHAARMGAFIAPLVSRGFRVVAIDLPGHGRHGVAATDLPTQAAAVAAVGRRLGPIHAVVGHSLGGTVAMLALRGGLAPQALVLLASPARLDRAVSRFQVLLGLPDRAVAGLRRRIEARFGVTVWDDYAADHFALDVPTLIIHDSDDPQVDIAESRMLAAAWPQAELIETAGLGHQRILRDPGVIGAVESFVGRASVRSAA
jgi:pimeloyl-ACP methyl ester carboxylesterase